MPGPSNLRAARDLGRTDKLAITKKSEEVVLLFKRLLVKIYVNHFGALSQS